MLMGYTRFSTSHQLRDICGLDKKGYNLVSSSMTEPYKVIYQLEITRSVYSTLKAKRW